MNAAVIAEHRSPAALARAGELSHLGRRALCAISTRPQHVPSVVLNVTDACGRTRGHPGSGREIVGDPRRGKRRDRHRPVFVAGSIAWGMVADGYRPDRFDAIGALVCLAGMAVIMYAPRDH
ncbi:YnfA family protein [Streptomyces atroolivaceus]|uniref:YnfA family protein n=1 Tax=Streptomyces atroolivaceus TaxID=66869 RepID=A0ABV9VJ01_STRAZ|nr:YnfA family protein [Streptomyces atroolivaceus]